MVGWKAAECGKLVDHAETEMNKWIHKHGQGVFCGSVVGELTAVTPAVGIGDSLVGQR